MFSNKIDDNNSHYEDDESDTIEDQNKIVMHKIQ